MTFADVAGVPSAKEELLEAVMCLRDASRYSKLNAQMPSGVLLVGPPGTGKTLLAKAVAGEAGTPVSLQPGAWAISHCVPSLGIGKAQHWTCFVLTWWAGQCRVGWELGASSLVE